MWGDTLKYEKHDWNKYFYHIDGKLYWKVARGNRIKPGDEAGTDNGSGYLRVKFLGSQYMVHKIIYIMHNGMIRPGYVIDHLDNDTMNNRPSNLAEKTVSDNNKNRRFKRNKSGVRGVYPYEGGFSASISVNGKRIHLGWRKTLQEAAELRRIAEMNYGYNK